MLKLLNMQIKDVGVSIVLVLLFWSFLGMTLEDRKLIKGIISSFDLNSDSEDSDNYLVEVLAISCRFELFHVKQVFDNINNQALTESSIRKALNTLNSQKKNNLFKCFRENYITSPISGEDTRAVSWFSKIVESHLPNLTPNADSRRRVLAQAPSKSPSPKKKAEDSFVIPVQGPKSPPVSDSTASNGAGGNNETTIVVAVVVTAIVTFFFALCLFCCCRKAFSGSSSSEYKDDGPLLLSLSRSDYPSNGASKAWGFENSIHKENPTNTEVEFANYSVASEAFIETPNPFDNNGFPTLQPPPGRGSGRHPGLPPLKPPPGRVESSLKPPPGRTESSLKPPPGRSESSLKPPPGRSESSLKPPPGRSESSLKPPLGKAEPPTSTSTGGPPPPPKTPAPPPAVADPPPPPPKTSGPRPPGPPPPPGPRPPGPPPPPGPGGKGGPRAPPGPPLPGGKLGLSRGKAGPSGDDASRAKLKPFFWDKVQANSDHSMVWDQLKSGSFVFNEEMIESLFGYTATENKSEKKKSSSEQTPKFIQLIDAKKAQNLSILLKALNVTTEEVRDALLEGNELPAELLETLFKMAPTAEEELKLRLFTGDLSQIGPAERFLKVLVDVPFAFKRLETLLFMVTVNEEATTVKEAFLTLEAACKELKSSRLFLKLLEAVLKTGNRMNDGTYRGGAQAFKLDTLLKLSDVKGTDGKTTLLHFVVQEIIRSEGVRAVRGMRESQSFSSIKSEDLLEDVPNDTEEHYRSLGLQVVSGLGDQLDNVRKAACLDSDIVTGTLARIGNNLLKAKNFLGKEMKEVEEDDGFHQTLKRFVEHAEGNIMTLLQEEKRIMALVKSTADYFHGSSGKEEGLRLFVIVRDFLIMLDKACLEVKARPSWPSKDQKKKDPPSRQTSTETPRTPMTPDFRQKLFPAIAERRAGNDGFSSDDE